MTKWAFALQAVLLAALATAAFVGAARDHGDLLELLIAVGLGLWSWYSFRVAGRHAPARKAVRPRP